MDIATCASEASGGWHDVRVSLPEVLAAVDLLAGVYLLYSLRRSRRHREAVAAVGLMLLLIAGGLLWVGRSQDPPPDVLGPAVVAPTDDV